MTKDYKSFTHIVNDMLEAKRQKIMNVPRDKKTPRDKLSIVGRPDDASRKSEDRLDTKQDEIQTKIIDEGDSWYITAKSSHFVGNAPGGKHKIHKIEKSSGGHDVYIRGGTHSFHIPDKKRSTGETSYKITRKSSSMPLDVHTAHRMMNETKIAQTKKPIDSVKHPKKLDISDVGKQPPTKVEINPEIDKVNVFASTEVKGNTLSEDDKPDEKSRKEAEAIAKFVRQFQGKSFGGFKVTGKLTDKDIQQGARIRARLNQLKNEDTENLVETSKEKAERYIPKAVTDFGHANFAKRHTSGSEKEYYTRQEKNRRKGISRAFKSIDSVKEETLIEAGSVSIQYQTNAGQWITARKTDRSPSNVLIAMETVQKAHDVNRVRAIDDKGSLVDMLAQQPVRVPQAELPFGKLETPLPTFKSADIPERPEPVTLGKIATDIGSWLRGEETVDEGRRYIRYAGLNRGPKKTKEEWAEWRAKTKNWPHHANVGKMPAKEKPEDRWSWKPWRDQTTKDKIRGEETQLDELKKETLERVKAKAEVTPQKDVRDMKKIWAGVVWPAEDRLSGRRMMPKKRGGYRRYHFDEEKLNEYEGLGIGAMRRWRQRPSDHKPASGWGGYGKPAKPKREQRNTMYPDIEKVYGAFKRQYEETLDETSVKELKKARDRTANAWLDNKPKSLENFKQVMKALKKKELEECDVPKRLQAGKKDDVVWRGGGMAQPIVKVAEKIYNKVTKKKVSEGEEYTGKILPFKIDKEGKRSLSVPDWIGGSIKYTGEVMRGETDPRDPANTGRNLAMAAVAATSAMPPFKAKAGAIAPEPVAAFHTLGSKPKSKSGKTMLKAERTIVNALQRIIEARHHGMETEEPKFSNSIQKVAAHAKWNAGAVHHYKHADGSKTKVDQDLGEKIHDLINTTPHRHRADLIQKIHSSKEGLEHALKHKWHGEK